MSVPEKSQNGPKPGPTTCQIGGVKVQFPMNPYPSQIGCMNMLIQGLKRGHNCLLESPTGSGKTLAMLSAALAWQRQTAEDAREFNYKIDEEYRKLEQSRIEKRANKSDNILKAQTENVCDASFEKGTEDNISKTGTDDGKPEKNESSTTMPTIDLCDTDSDDDFQELKRTRKPKIPTPAVKQLPPPTPNDGSCVKEPEKPQIANVPTGIPQKMKVPKIFFATRTHQQIAQVTRELRKTSYKSSRTMILASRETTCVNPIVAKKSNKNEACKELLDTVNKGGGCGWYNAAKKFGNFDVLQGYGLQLGYDLEDFVKVGTMAKACPYYAARQLLDSADMIFCPYNYIIDSNIRKSMGIELAGQIVIFDEGHNMEDASREAASYSVAQADIQAAMQDCEKMSNCNVEPLAHQQLAQLMSDFSIWMDNNQNNFVEVDFNTTGYVWSGTAALASFDFHGISSERIIRSVQILSAIMRAKELENELAKDRGFSKSDKPALPSQSLSTVETILKLSNYLIKDDGKYREDFRVALMRTTAKNYRGNREKAQKGFVVTLNLWCLNPAVAFSEITDVARSVIITSGTLSPFDSFQSELGCPFPTKLECQHVIKPEQILAKVITRGRKGFELRGTYQNVNSFDYQDEIGNIVLDVCNIMPYGVLVFFPSYRLMDVLKSRWALTGVLDSIQENKRIFVEPRTGAADFLETIQDYYETIQEATRNPSGVRGALFMAVCRGKVSEGLDFADNNARAVLCIGIPFPNARELQVVHKKSYNDANRGRGLLSGNKWYEIQAFRALNQAMGRCIRHKNDFGAVYLLDCRFGDKDYLQPLPKWFRTRVTFSKWDNMALQELSEYFKSMAPLQSLVQVKDEEEKIATGFDLSQTDDDDQSSYFSSVRPSDVLRTPKGSGRASDVDDVREREDRRATPSMKRTRDGLMFPKDGTRSIPDYFNQNKDNKKPGGGINKIIL